MTSLNFMVGVFHMGGNIWATHSSSGPTALLRCSASQPMANNYTLARDKRTT